MKNGYCKAWMNGFTVYFSLPYLLSTFWLAAPISTNLQLLLRISVHVVIVYFPDDMITWHCVRKKLQIECCIIERYKHTENRIRILTGAPEFFCGHSSRHDLKADNRFTLQTIIITQAIFKFHCYLAVYHSLPKVFKDNK